MHECDKDDRIKELEARNEKLELGQTLIKLILTPKMVLAITIAFCVLLQTISNLLGGGGP